MTNLIDRLGNESAHLMMRSAVEYMAVNGLNGRVDLDALVASLRAVGRVRCGQAVDEALEASSVGMDAVGVATFRASMVLAGIEAVKAVVASRAAR